MNISYKPITLCFVFVVLGSTLAFARPMTRAETGCRSYEKKRRLVLLRYRHHPPRAAMRVAAYRIRLKMIGLTE
jgi:hypothetical protein